MSLFTVAKWKINRGKSRGTESAPALLFGINGIDNLGSASHEARC